MNDPTAFEQIWGGLIRRQDEVYTSEMLYKLLLKLRCIKEQPMYAQSSVEVFLKSFLLFYRTLHSNQDLTNMNTFDYIDMHC